jgi:hypothetical protein
MAFYINMESITKKTLKAAQIKGFPKAEAKIQKRFNFAYQKMIEEFEDSKVTQEIEAGPEAPNYTNSLGGYGNLFSFIGFPRGTNPVEPLRQLLINTNVKYTSFRNNRWYFRVNLPTRNKITAATPMPWEGLNSWAYAVERNISNLSHYLYEKTSAGRSKEALQVKPIVHKDLSFKKVNYISFILEHFKNRINGV